MHEVILETNSVKTGQISDICSHIGNLISHINSYDHPISEGKLYKRQMRQLGAQVLHPLHEKNFPSAVMVRESENNESHMRFRGAPSSIF